MNLIAKFCVGLAFAVSGAAHAATVTDTCGNIGYGVEQDGVALSPLGCGVGNDEGNNGYGTINGWTLLDSVDETGGVGANGLLTVSNVDKEWSVSLPFGLERLAIAFKQARSYVFYELDVTQILSGTWTTSGPGNSVNDYSHANLWYIDSRFPIGTDPYDSPPPVPLPTSGLLLVAGIGTLGLSRRRKSR